MKRLANNLYNYWFQPLPAARLGILRIATGGLSLWYLLSRYEMLMRLPSNSLSMYVPVGLMQLFPAEPFSAAVFQWILLATICFNILFIIGWKFRFTGPVFAVLLLLFFCYRNSWSMIYHNYNLLVLHVLVIGFSWSADSMSADRKRKGNYNANDSSHWKYGWPVKLICLITVFSYFISGVAKISGDLAWDWLTGEAMRSQVAVDNLRKNVMGEESSALFENLYAHTWLFFMIGIITMLVELGAPFVLAKKRLIRLWVLAAFLMHWGIFFMMGIRFYHHMSGIVFLSFLEPEKWWNAIRYRFTRKKHRYRENITIENPSLVLFDGVCNFCDRTIQFIIKHDPNGYFRFASLQSDIGKKMLKEYNLTADLSTLVLIKNGKAYERSTAMLKILRELRGGWKWLYAFIIIPAPLRNIFYNLISKNRYRISGEKTVCQLPGPEIRNRFYTGQ